MVTALLTVRNAGSGPWEATDRFHFRQQARPLWARGSAPGENDSTKGSFRAGKPHSLARVNKSLKNSDFARNEFRPGTWAPFPRPGRWVGEFMTEILRKTASTWLPVALTAAVVGIGIAVAAW